MLFVKNSEINSSQVLKLRQKNPNYEPDKRFPLNLTAVHLQTETYAQLAINWNLCEVSCTNYESLKTNLLLPIVDYMINSVKKMMSATMANEVGFKLIFYFPHGTPAANATSWNGSLLASDTAFWSGVGENNTALGTNFSLPHIKVTLPIVVDNNFSFQKEKNCLRCGLPNARNAAISSPNNSLMSNAWGPVNTSSAISSTSMTATNSQNPWNSSSLANVNWGSSWNPQANTNTSGSNWTGDFAGFPSPSMGGGNQLQPTQTQTPSLFQQLGQNTNQNTQNTQTQLYNGFGSMTGVNQNQSTQQHSTQLQPLNNMFNTNGFGFQ